MVNQTNTCANKNCQSRVPSKDNQENNPIPLLYCFTHYEHVWNQCAQIHHSEWKTEEEKTYYEAAEQVSYLKILVAKLKDICDLPMAKKMIKEEVDALLTFLFEFKMFWNIFKKAEKEQVFKHQDWTRLFYKFQWFHKSLKSCPAYIKAIQFEFEQKVCHDFERENTKTACSSPNETEGPSTKKSKCSKIFENFEKASIVEEELPFDKVIKKPRGAPRRRVSLIPIGVKNLIGEQLKSKEQFKRYSNPESYEDPKVQKLDKMVVSNKQRAGFTPEKRIPSEYDFRIRQINMKPVKCLAPTTPERSQVKLGNKIKVLKQRLVENRKSSRGFNLPKD